MGQYLLNFPDWQKKAIHDLSSVTGYSMAEILRRIIDRGLHEPVVWELFPVISGRILHQTHR